MDRHWSRLNIFNSFLVYTNNRRIVYQPNFVLVIILRETENRSFIVDKRGCQSTLSFFFLPTIFPYLEERENSPGNSSLFLAIILSYLTIIYTYPSSKSSTYGIEIIYSNFSDYSFMSSIDYHSSKFKILSKDIPSMLMIRYNSMINNSIAIKYSMIMPE